MQQIVVRILTLLHVSDFPFQHIEQYGQIAMILAQFIKYFGYVACHMNASYFVPD